MSSADITIQNITFAESDLTNQNDRHIPHCGDCYWHFKNNEYVIVDGDVENCTNNDDKKRYVVYQRLDDTKCYIRELDEFLSPVDKEKYPSANQYWRFELIKDRRRTVF